MPTPSLHEFAEAVPLCERTSGLATVLEIFRSSGCDAIVVVSEQQHPLGVINHRQLMPHLLSLFRIQDTPVGIESRDLYQSLSQLEPLIIQPLTILPAQLGLSQFCAYLQESGERLTDSKPYWGLVDEDDKFLGLLDNWRLLKALASELTATEVAQADEQQQRTGLEPLVQLLEQLPLPLSLETATGQVLAENLAWRQQISTSPALDGIGRTPATALAYRGVETHSEQIFDKQHKVRSPIKVAANTSKQPSPSDCWTNIEPATNTTREVSASGQNNSKGNELSAVERSLTAAKKPVVATLKAPATSALTRSTPCSQAVPDSSTKPLTRSLAVKNATKKQYESSAQEAIQGYSAMDSPHTAASVSQHQTLLSALPAIATQDNLMSSEASAPASEVRKPSPENVSFVKLPVPLSIVSQERGRGGEKNSAYLLSDLWIVLAQDTTEQQQVAKELAAKNADLVQLNRLKDEFLACISHELKTPLTAILGLSSLLKDQTLGKLNERQARYARLIYQSGRQLMTVVNDILDLTRMETGQLELTLEPVQIQSVCDRAYSQAQQRPSEKDQLEEGATEIPFSLEIEPGLETIVADDLRLRQMLLHLLSNALKFTEASGEIGLRVNCWEGWIAFTVWDTGIGIPEEKQHLIFQKFQQLENTLTRRFEGAGLGLVLTQRLARLHGGDVSFISKDGQGSEFTIVLPPCPPPGSMEAEEIFPTPIPNSQSPIRNRLILIVETVPAYLEDLTNQLNDLGYHVVIARSGPEAIEKARSLQPCVILLNPLLPKLSGWDVLTLLKSDAQTLHIPVLVTATQAEKQQAYHNKADGFLSLPVQEQALVQSLNSLGEPQRQTSKSLTILCLSPEEVKTRPDSSVISSELTDVLSLQLAELNYRVLEADDLEQAELLALVWKPDVILLDSKGIADSFAYLNEFSSYPTLTSLPLVTLDRQTSEAANQITGLTVYPCLAPDTQQKMTSLLQVIQVAAGIACQPNILVMDIGEPGKTLQVNRDVSPERLYKVKGSQLLKVGRVNVERDAANIANASASETPALTQSEQSSNLQPYAPWLQALIQYLQTAGFRSSISCSWTQVYRQLQARSVDLLLIRLTDIGDASALANGLIYLAQLPKLPPVLVLDHRLNPTSPASATAAGDRPSELDLLLRAVATRILHGSSQSMLQLLEQINQILDKDWVKGEK